MTTVNEDIDAVAGDPSVLHLDGADIDVRVEELRTRQLFKLLKMLTVGAGPLLADLRISPDSDQGELAQSIIALLLVSIPDAEDEFIDFLKGMVAPVDLLSPERTKEDRQENIRRYTELWEKLDNPRPTDTMLLVKTIVEKEIPNMMALGKEIAAMLPVAAKQTTSSKKRSTKQTPSDS